MEGGKKKWMEIHKFSGMRNCPKCGRRRPTISSECRIIGISEKVTRRNGHMLSLSLMDTKSTWTVKVKQESQQFDFFFFFLIFSVTLVSEMIRDAVGQETLTLIDSIKTTVAPCQSFRHLTQQ